MAAPLEFYFDFSSPYGYIAAQRIDALAAKHGRSVDWRPMLLGAVFKVAGTQPLTDYPLKGKYSTHDFKRSAREHGIAFHMPAVFPLPTQGACRGTYWLKQAAPDKAVPFARAVYAAYFVEGQDISSAEVLADIATALGIDRKAFLAGIESPEIKAKLREVTEDAIQHRGVFGSPYTFVDGEPFWGADRLDQIDRWLSRGGW
ncbi:MAG: 2-hydroxychromene-2-carboxylate isomerase [Ferrovibrio sp.]|uniref:2-hydroxychromene-2-carboxylate isomerase n=1 Tax=Ferrovibrio sp. TaxID=1917215 RepID=UPI0026208E5C|nr:2-hydroxychromene-2-carboxylate isomerase [Ferrovibrio sp.]MCW0232143.1 2-hydroxychromene-2-carboxylate isomerase [Ferrovibrio sp.]